jgi:hypothetical protein
MITPTHRLGILGGGCSTERAALGVRLLESSCVRRRGIGSAISMLNAPENCSFMRFLNSRDTSKRRI